MIDISEWIKNLTEECCVYRYTDMSDGIIKYVGIVYNGTLANRCKSHTHESWYKDGEYLVEYIIVNNRSEAEAIESHLISLYETDRYYNKAKATWGVNSFLPQKYDWKPVTISLQNLLLRFQKTLDFHDEKAQKTIPISRVRDYINEIYYINRVDDFCKKIKLRNEQQ